MTISRNKALEILGEMRHYFSECAKNADPQSDAYKRFVEYVIILAELSWDIRNDEDDGK